MGKDEVFLKETEVLHSLRALEEIEKNSNISQRELSNRLGVALGITNTLLKTLVRKGLIKIRGNNNRTLTYHLTHAGVLAKSRLAMGWTLNTIDFYRQARLDVASKLIALAEQGATSIVLYGGGAITEITSIVALEAGFKIVGIIGNQPSGGAESMFGYSLIQFSQLADETLDAVVICEEISEADLHELSRYIDATASLYRLF